MSAHVQTRLNRRLVSPMRRRRNITAWFTGIIVIASVGLVYGLMRQNRWWNLNINATSVAIENRGDESVEIVSLSVDGLRRDVNQRLEAGAFTLLLGFYSEISPGGYLAFELVFKPGPSGTEQIFRHRAAVRHRAQQCDFKFVMRPEGMDIARSCPRGPTYDDQSLDLF
jgi:hypothetical protein